MPSSGVFLKEYATLNDPITPEELENRRKHCLERVLTCFSRVVGACAAALAAKSDHCRQKLFGLK